MSNRNINNGKRAGQKRSRVESEQQQQQQQQPSFLFQPTPRDEEICVSTEDEPPSPTPAASSLELDLEKVLVTAALFVVAFLLLSPVHSLRSRRRRQQRQRERLLSKEQAAAADFSSKEESSTSRAVGTSDAPTSSSTPPPVPEDILWDGTFPSLRKTTSAPTSPATQQGSIYVGRLLPTLEEIDLEDTTDEETFAQLWPAIRVSPYRRLVLPPQCKRVDKPQVKPPPPEPKSKNEIEKKKNAAVDDDDNPARRLSLYAQHIWYFLRSLLSYDYVSALLWLVHCLIRLRHFRTHRAQEEAVEEEDEDDEVSQATHASALPRAGPNHGCPESPLRSSPADVVSPLQSPSLFNGVSELTPNTIASENEEEKKDMTEPRVQDLDTSMNSFSSLPGPNMAESTDEIDNTPSQLQNVPPMLPGLSGVARPGKAGKRKDALELYRGHGKSIALAPKTLAAQQQLIAPSSNELQEEPIKSPIGSDERQRSDTSDSMVFFDAAHSRDSLKKMTVDVPVPDRNGYVLGDDFLPNSRHTPLLVFVNSRSGPQQGQLLITQLRRLLNPIQVWDLADGGPEKVLESFCVMSRLRLLVCGGDGTVSWIISTLEKMEMDPQRWPPLAILPLGTGNDLARIHGWGGGYSNESLITILQQVAEGYISLLDRWEMTVENKKGKMKEAKSFINYLGVGVDAQAALQVHMLRESTPKLFFSRAVNKAWYAVFGAEDAIKASHANLPQNITLIADGVEVPLPADSQGIIVLNIDSYAGGIPIWSHGTKAGSLYDSRRLVNDSMRDVQLRRTVSLDSVHNGFYKSNTTFDRVDSMDDLLGMDKVLTEEEKLAQLTSCDLPSSCQDGVLDIVSIRGTVHLGQIRVGLGNAQKLCQCREATIVIKRKTAVQIDGEPWRQGACTLHIKRKKDSAMMLHRSAYESGGVETEMAKLLDWAEDRGIIDRTVHSTLMKEFSRRIESKTRQRRVQSQDNLVLSLKRAIASTNSPFPTQKAFSQNMKY